MPGVAAHGFLNLRQTSKWCVKKKVTLIGLNVHGMAMATHHGAIFFATMPWFINFDFRRAVDSCVGSIEFLKY